MAGPTLRSFSTKNDGTLLPKPPGATERDVLIAFVAQGGLASPAWTPLATVNLNLRMYYRVLTASEPASWSMGGVWPVGVCLAFSGAGVPVLSNAAAGDTAASLTTTEQDSVLLYALFTQSFGSGYAPAGMTHVAGASRGDSGSVYNVQVSSELRAATGPTGSRTSGLPPGLTLYSSMVVVPPAALPPNAPTLTNPANGGTINVDQTNVFTWSPNHPDGSIQSKYDLQVREQGTTDETTYTATSTTSARTFTGGSLSTGDLEWRVRTYNAVGTEGAWSSWSQFTAGSAPSDLTLVAPTSGGTISGVTSLVEWSTPDQDTYQVRTVADNAGVIDEGTVYEDTGEVVSTSTRQAPIAHPVQRYEWVQVRVRVSGIWSDWESARVLVSFTPPLTPTVVSAPHLDSHDHEIAIDVQAVNPTPDDTPAVVSLDIWRKDPAHEPDPIRVATGHNPATIFTDRTTAPHRNYEYRVYAYAANGTFSVSDWSGPYLELDGGGAEGGDDFLVDGGGVNPHQQFAYDGGDA